MDVCLLEEFDIIVRLLGQARERYELSEYLASYRLSHEAELHLRALEETLGARVMCAKIRKDNSSGSLNTEETARLYTLNEMLTGLETTINREIEDITERRGKTEMTDGRLIRDYEIDVTVTFHLDEKDPEHNDRSDNIVAETHYTFIDKKKPLFDLAQDYNHIPVNLGHPDFGRHCRLFHELYDHTEPLLTFRDLLRIGMIWTEVIVHDQHFTYLASFPEYTKGAP